MLAVFAWPIWCAGCFGPTDDTIAIWGKVTLDGVPVATGDIEFSSKDNTGFRRGTLITAGQYRTAPMQGLLPGEFLVRIFSVSGGNANMVTSAMPGDNDGLGSAASRDAIPAKYNMRSSLTISVSQEGDHQFDFALTSK